MISDQLARALCAYGRLKEIDCQRSQEGYTEAVDVLTPEDRNLLNRIELEIAFGALKGKEDRMAEFTASRKVVNSAMDQSTEDQ